MGQYSLGKNVRGDKIRGDNIYYDNGSYVYVIKIAVTKTIRMLSVYRVIRCVIGRAKTLGCSIEISRDIYIIYIYVTGSEKRAHLA